MTRIFYALSTVLLALFLFTACGTVSADKSSEAATAEAAPAAEEAETPTLPPDCARCPTRISGSRNWITIVRCAGGCPR